MDLTGSSALGPWPGRTRLLIIDDWGPEPLNAAPRSAGSSMIVKVDPTLGDAILDRVIHRSHWIELKGGSLRKLQALAAVESLTNANGK